MHPTVSPDLPESQLQVYTTLSVVKLIPCSPVVVARFVQSNVSCHHFFQSTSHQVTSNPALEELSSLSRGTKKTHALNRFTFSSRSTSHTFLSSPVHGFLQQLSQKTAEIFAPPFAHTTITFHSILRGPLQQGTLN